MHAFIQTTHIRHSTCVNRREADRSGEKSIQLEGPCSAFALVVIVRCFPRSVTNYVASETYTARNDSSPEHQLQAVKPEFNRASSMVATTSGHSNDNF